MDQGPAGFSPRDRVAWASTLARVDEDRTSHGQECLPMSPTPAKRQSQRQAAPIRLRRLADAAPSIVTEEFSGPLRWGWDSGTILRRGVASGAGETDRGAESGRQRLPAACGRLYEEKSPGDLTAHDLLLTAVPMIRKTVTLFSLIGLLLSVGLWGVSYWNLVRINYKRAMSVAQGGFESRDVFPHSLYIPMQIKPDGSVEPLHLNRWSFSGFGGWQTRWLPEFSRSPQHIYVPLWMPTASFGVMFASCRPLRIHRRRKRKKLGLCIKCGYDLRGSKGRCPECGDEFETT